MKADGGLAAMPIRPLINPRHQRVGIEVIMKIRELAQHWEENAKGRLTDTRSEERRPVTPFIWTWKPPPASPQSAKCTPSAAPRNCSAN